METQINGSRKKFKITSTSGNGNASKNDKDYQPEERSLGSNQISEVSARSEECPIHQRSVVSPRAKERTVSEISGSDRSEECAIHQKTVAVSPKPKERSNVQKREILSPKPYSELSPTVNPE